MLDQDAGVDIKGCLEEGKPSVAVCPDCFAEFVIHVSHDQTWRAVDATTGSDH